MSRPMLDTRVGPYFDAWETATVDERSALQRRRLDEYVRHALQAPFYEGRLDAYDAKAEHPLLGVPVLTATELRAHLPMTGTALLSRQTTDYTVFQSGGTTGMPKTSLFTHDELEGLNLPNARGFHAVGLTAEDRVANLFAVGGLYMTFVHINRMLQQYGCMNFPFSNQTPVDFIKTVTTSFGINCFTGIASVVLNCLREIHRTGGGEALRVRKIFYGGEHVYEADKQEMRQKLGVEVIAAPGYGTVDTWYLGYQCERTGTGAFHAHDDQVWLEIVDEDTGKPCAPGEKGMLYATAYERRLTPIVRYRVGDHALWQKEPCACGRTTPVFQLLGRGDDVLRIGYDSLDYDALQGVVAKVGGLTAMVQMEKRRDAGKDLLVIRVESDAPASRWPEQQRALAAALLEDRPSLRAFVEKGTIHPVRIEVLAPGAIPLNPRTGKLIRVIDAL